MVQNFFVFLSWATPVIFVVAKVALTRGLRVGWSLQIVGTLGAIIIAFYSDMIVWLLLEVWAVALYIYSFNQWSKESQEVGFGKTNKVLTFVSGVLMLVALICNHDLTSVIEALAAGVFMLGTILLSNKEELSQKRGWMLYSTGHLALSTALFTKGLDVFAIQQIICAGIAIWRNKKPVF